MLLSLVPLLWDALKSAGHSGDNRLLTSAATDVSRLIYFQLGIDHFIAKPFGNVSIYSANTTLQNYHNTFLTLANRNGVIAIISLLFVVILSLYRSAKLLKCNLSLFMAIVPVFIYLYCYLIFIFHQYIHQILNTRSAMQPSF